MILRGHDNVEARRGEGIHKGVGEFGVRTLLEEEFESSLAYVRELVLKAGSSVGIHEHQGDEEIYYIASGQGLMMVDDEKHQVKSGDAILTRSGSCHGLLNEGDEDLKIFVVCAKLKKE